MLLLLNFNHQDSIDYRDIFRTTIVICSKFFTIAQPYSTEQFMKVYHSGWHLGQATYFWTTV